MSTEWNFGDGATSGEEHPTHVFNIPGEFTIELAVENDSECADSMLMDLEVHPHHQVNIDTVICEGESFLFPEGTWVTVTADTSSSNSLASFIGCDSTVHLSIEVAPNSAFTQEVSLSPGNFYVFPDGSEAFIFSDTSQVSNLISIHHCDSLVTTIITVEDQPISDPVKCLTPPNVFTPGNGDGKNHFFYFPSEQVAVFKCKIVNRWGQLVYQYESINDAWDGTTQTTGADCPTGVYYYVYEGEYNNGEFFNGYGFVHLVRE